MELTFENKKAVVTGAGRGIGKAIAQKLAAEGVHVICVSRSENSCGSAAEEIKSSGGSAQALAVDVADKQAVAQASEQLLAEHGVIDILINNAGITKDNLVLRMSDEEWQDVIDTNLSSAFYWTKGLVRPMTRSRWGRIINISSVVGIMGNPGQTNYSAAKAGMLGYTKSLARELASRNVTANAIAPGFIDTDMTSVLGDSVQEQILKIIPLKRLGHADDIANMATYLASEQSNYITGQVFSIDGGMVM